MNPTGFADKTAPSALPLGWAWASLTDVARLNPPLDLPPSDNEQEVVFVPMAAVDEGFAGVQRPEVRTYGQVKKGYTPFQAGDVIMAKITPCMENGKGGVVRGEIGTVFFGSTEFHVLRPKAGIDAGWIGAFLAQERVRHAARLGMKGSAGQLRVPPAFLDQLHLPIPPSSEQIRIADRIDELFTDLSAGGAALERVKRNLSRYRAAVLHAAVTGRLTEAWRKEHGHDSGGDEPGPKLLERIIVERRRQWEEHTLAKYEKNGKKPPKDWKSRYPEPAEPKPLVDGAELPPLPKSWCWASVDQLIWDGCYGTSVRCDYEAPGDPVLRIPNIARGELDLDDIKNATASLGIEDEGEYLSPGDLLVCRTNGSIRLIGKAALVRAPFDRPTYFASYLIRLRAIDLPLATHLHLTFTSAHGRAFIEANAASSAGQHNVSMTTLQQMPVAIPPAAEQAAIVEAVNEKLSQIDSLEAEVERGLKRAGRLRQAILKAAFEGKLVPQDPSDEPASVLLERIRDAVASTEPKRARPRKAPRVGKRSPGKVIAS